MEPLMDVCKRLDLNRFTVAQVAKKGKFGEGAKQYGRSWMLDSEHPAFQTWLNAHWEQSRVIGETVNKMEDSKPTLLEQTQSIREKYQRGEITPTEAKKLIKPYYDEYIERVEAKAKEAGMRVPHMSLDKFLRRRSDLRYVAQQRVSEQRMEEEQ